MFFIQLNDTIRMFSLGFERKNEVTERKVLGSRIRKRHWRNKDKEKEPPYIDILKRKRIYFPSLVWMTFVEGDVGLE